MRNYKKLNVWSNSLNLCSEIYSIAKILPDNERYGLYSQVTRSAVSIPSNIAEGCAKSSVKDLVRFLEIALGSSFELETQLIIIKENFIQNNDKLESIIQQQEIVQKQLISFIYKIKHKM